MQWSKGLSVFSPAEISKNNLVATIPIIAAGINNKVKKELFIVLYGEIWISNSSIY